jgi:hypothetical protein
MYSPVAVALRYPIQMPNRKRTRAKKATSNAQVNALVKSVKQLSVKPKKAKPFRDTGGVIGNRIGGMFGNASIGRGIGRWLGTGIGSIFGSGDYTLSGSAPAYNVIANGSQIPKFDTTRQTNVVCHREYLGDILGTAAFNNRQFPLNPGMSTTFPWLSTLAASYQEYKFHGLIFEFRSLITDFVTGGAPGVIVMSTNYNADAPTYINKQQMENAEFAVSTKPTINLMHGVECADKQTILPQRYVRNSSPPSGQDLRLYDLGNFQFATASNPIQDLGELWVSYCVEFFKPVQATVTDVPGVGEHTRRSVVAAANPLGTATTFVNGGENVIFQSDRVIIVNSPVSVNYKIDFLWTGTAAASTFPGAALGANTATVNLFDNGANPSFTSPSVAATVTGKMMHSVTITNSGTIPGDISYVLLPGGAFPTPSSIVEIWVTQLDPAIII